MIFVFGSNLKGVHGAGAADYAYRHLGAIWGQGVGLQGQSYAIPTKDYRIETLPIDSIRKFVDGFKEFATSHPELTFQVTRVGCGLAGYTDAEMAPLFEGAPSNCLFPDEWKSFFPLLPSSYFWGSF